MRDLRSAIIPASKAPRSKGESAEYAAAWKEWSNDPMSFMIIARCGAVGWKPKA